MKAYTIRRKLLRLTLLPPLGLLLVILGYFIYQDHKLLHESLLARGEMVVRYLASASEYGVITGNTTQLQRISDSVLQGDIVTLRVYDFDKRVIFMRGEVTLARSGDFDESITGQCGGSDHYLLFCTPINLPSLPVSDYERSDSGLEAGAIGYIELTLSSQLIAQKRAVILRWSLLLLLLVVVLALWLTRRMERQLVMPLMTLSRTVEKVRRGDLAVQVAENASGELLSLQQGVNAMVQELANSHQHMAQEIESATGCLRDTMQALEQRNEELLQEQHRAESASLAKSQFLATMSHEIRTPLSGMIGMLQLLRDGTENRSQLECLDSLQSAAQSLRQLIDDILDFSRLEVGKLALQNRPFVPLAVIEEAMLMFTPSAHHKGLEFVLDINGGVPATVVGDSLRFRQVLINLTANAIKFTREGEVLVRVLPVVSHMSGSAALRFEICDSGIGIPAEKQPLVFESFTQLDEGDARNYGGSGLGTTVSRELVSMMGGEIGLDSEQGKGSCFWFELPWERPEEEVLQDTGAMALLLERHQPSALAIGRMLRTLGIGCRVVNSETALRQALSEHEYGWVFISENSSESKHQLLVEKLASQLPPGSRLCQLGYVNGRRAEYERVEFLSKPLLPTILRLWLEMPEQVQHAAERQFIGRALTVLLAEDEAINARVITHFLEQGGHRVIRVCDGEEALAQLQRQRVDCVLMDLRMPGMDGLEATRRWRREELASRRVPIIALTANASEEDRQRCSEAGMDDYLTKPVDSRALLATLARYCP